MTWATVADVEARWVGGSLPASSDVVNALIADAESIILAEYPRIQERIDDLSLNEATVRMVVCRMVSRLLRNPESLTYFQQATGPFSMGKNYGASGNTDIWLSADEKSLLAPAGRGKAFTVNLGPNMIDPGREDVLWESVN